MLCRMHGLLSSGTSVDFMWVPSHVGLAGNSAADSATKAALHLPVSNLTWLWDYNWLILTQALKQWQLRWKLKLRTYCMPFFQSINVWIVFISHLTFNNWFRQRNLSLSCNLNAWFYLISVIFCQVFIVCILDPFIQYINIYIVPIYWTYLSQISFFNNLIYFKSFWTCLICLFKLFCSLITLIVLMCR